MLKQISIKNRTLFLEHFTQELILNSRSQIKTIVPEKIVIQKPQIKKEIPKEVKIKKKEIKKGGKHFPFSVTPFSEIVKKIEDKISKEEETITKKITQDIGEIPKIGEIEEEAIAIPASREFSLPDLQEIENKLTEKHITEPLPKTRIQKPEEDLFYRKSPKLENPNPIKPSQKTIHPVKQIEPKIRKPKPFTITTKRKFTAPKPGLKKSLTPLPLVSPPESQKIDLGKLNILTSDPGITTIECPGPRKFILVKRLGRVNITSITLSQEEINKIIYDFSESARIPAIGGPFKAIVGNLSINAIVADSIGNKFIIYKSGSPYPRFR